MLYTSFTTSQTNFDPKRIRHTWVCRSSNSIFVWRHQPPQWQRGDKQHATTFWTSASNTSFLYDVYWQPLISQQQLKEATPHLFQIPRQSFHVHWIENIRFYNLMMTSKFVLVGSHPKNKINRGRLEACRIDGAAAVASQDKTSRLFLSFSISVGFYTSLTIHNKINKKITSRPIL